jgi:tRNA pseudouridine38-40 synthase
MNPTTPRRIRMLVQYDGASFQGWQRQAEGPTIQAALEDGLAKLLGEPIRVHSAGRTDTGVHALAMPVHFETTHRIPANKIAPALGPFLPEAIGAIESDGAPEGWDARRSARLRWYRYQVLMGSRRRPLGPRAWRVFRPLDLDAMERAIGELAGRHDFSGFRSSQCQAKRTVLDLEQATLTHVGKSIQKKAGGTPALPGATLTRAGELIAFDFKCRSFLHHMVRFMVGTLVSVGLGQIDLARLRRIRDRSDRPQLALCAPPEGLCLMGVGYTAAECDAIRAAAPAPPSF